MPDDKRQPAERIGGIGIENRIEKPEVQRGQDTEGPIAERGGVREAEAGFVRGLPAGALNLIHSRFMRMDNPTLQVFVRALNRVLHDRREDVGTRHPPREKGEAEHGSVSHEPQRHIKDGRLKETRERQYENHLAERKFPAVKKEDGAEPRERETRKISDFEAMLVARFEQAKKLERAIKEGKVEFLEKTVEQWRAFFEKFSARTDGKKADLAEIDQFLFRGVVKKSDTKAVVISDIIYNSGKTDKFSRFGVIYSKIGDFLSNLIPGDRISKQAIVDGLLSEELVYLALGAPAESAEIQTGLKPRQGLFAAEATEARVAEELGINMDKGAPATTQSGPAGKGKRRKTSGFFGWLAGDEDVPLDESPQFIPWWRWGNLNKPGRLGLKRAFYSAVIILFVLAVLFMIDRYLLGK